jgi:tetratricopeptide (TPR) repeat protein
MKELEAQGFSPVTEMETTNEPVVESDEWKVEPVEVVETQPILEEVAAPAEVVDTEPILEDVAAPAEVVDILENPVVETEDQPEIVDMERPTEAAAPEPDEPSQQLNPSGDQLSDAQSAMAAGHVDTAVELYVQLIQSDQNLGEAIHDLRNALYHHPVDVDIWQTLGDAYLRQNQVQEALDAYTKAEELMR